MEESRRKCKRMDEFDQSTLYAYMEVSHTHTQNPKEQKVKQKKSQWRV
jgi:hypothetical protein